MYRLLCAVFVYMSFVSSAPQDASSDFTFVKPLNARQSLPESREDVQTIPLPKQNENSSSENQYIQNEGRTTPSELQSNDSQQNNENDNQQYTKSEVSTVTYESSSEATEKSTTLEVRTEVAPSRAKSASPRFISKLGYFKNTDNYGSPAVTNYIERTGKRKFKSRCRCEKITNCPKLQITVPRCPEEYFLCCF